MLAAPGSKRLNKSVNPPKTTSNGIIYAVLTFTSADILTLHSRAFLVFVLNISEYILIHNFFLREQFLHESIVRDN